MIDGVTNGDSIPVLERLMQFSGARHRIIANNMANLSTPDFVPVDLSVDRFQGQLAEAIDERREQSGNTGGSLAFEETDEIRFSGNQLVVTPQPRHDNIMFHDGNDRDLERLTQSLVENFTAFRTAAQLLRSRFDIINTAISERV